MIKFLQSVNPYNKIWKLFLLNFVIALFAMLFFTHSYLTSPLQYFKYFIWVYAICITQWVGHVHINNKLNQYFTWEKHTLKRAFATLIFIIGYAVVAYLLVQALMTFIFAGKFPNTILDFITNSGIVLTVIIAFGVTLLFTAIGFLKAWKKSLLEAEEFKREMLVYKYESLQNQINPHFLFNSFNVLNDLVYEDQKKAVFFIKKLSQLFRYVLDSKDKELVSVKEELAFIESFAFLLQTRFENKLRISIAVNADENEMIVPMALQILLENCVKHNEISTQHPLSVTMVRKGNAIEVSNNKQLKPTGPESKKIGIANMKQQYKYFTDEEIVIAETNDKFSVQIPILKI